MDPNVCQIECQNKCQIKCKTECQTECRMYMLYMSDRIPERMPNRMSGYMSDRMPEMLSEYMSNRMSVGGDHSKEGISQITIKLLSLAKLLSQIYDELLGCRDVCPGAILWDPHIPNSVTFDDLQHFIHFPTNDPNCTRYKNYASHAR